MTFSMSMIIVFLSAGSLGIGGCHINSLLAPGQASAITVGREYVFQGFISSDTELRVYPKLEEPGSVRNCVSAIYGTGANRPFFRSHHRQRVTFTAVIAEYRDGLIVGANQALTEENLVSFENQCGGDLVLVITGH